MDTLKVAEKAMEAIEKETEHTEDKIQVVSILAKLIHPGYNIVFDNELA